MAKLPRQKMHAPVMERTGFDIANDIGRAVLQGVTLGTSDEIYGLYKMFTSDKTYEEARQEIIEGLERFRETDPVKAYGFEILGSMLTGGGAALGAGRMGATKAGQLALAGLESSVYGAATGETPEERMVGGAIGAVTGPVTAGIGQKITPVLQEGAKSMISRGYPLTMGQAFGGKIGAVEEKVSLPFLQESIKEARAIPQRMFMNETINNAIAPLGKKVPEGVTGEEAIDFAEAAISEAYQSVVPKAKFSPASANEKINAILKKAVDDGVLDDVDLKEFKKELSDVYFRKQRNGQMTGELFKEAESEISSSIRAFKSKGQRRQQRIMQEIQSELREEFANQNPDLPDLQAANKAFANTRNLKKLSEAATARQGVFTPAALAKAETKRLGRFAPEVKRAREARDILGATIPDSGTAGREAVSELLRSPIKGSVGLWHSSRNLSL